RLLSTSPRSDAVTFSYGLVNACPKRTCTALLSNTLRRTSRRLCRGLCENGTVPSLNMGCAAPIAENPGRAGG
ncbi:MAG: hypothetical protein ABSH08_14085, partial [Tepidisphaeraceae bacterium]